MFPGVWGLTLVGPMNRVGWGLDSPMGRGTFERWHASLL